MSLEHTIPSPGPPGPPAPPAPVPSFVLSVAVTAAYVVVKLWLSFRIKKRPVPVHVVAYRWIMWGAGQHFISFLLLAILGRTHSAAVGLGLRIGVDVFLIVGHLLLMLGTADLVGAWHQSTHSAPWHTDIYRAVPMPATAVGVIGAILHRTLAASAAHGETDAETAAMVHVRRCEIASGVLYLIVCFGLLSHVMRARREALVSTRGPFGDDSSDSDGDRERPEAEGTHTWTTNLLFLLLAACTAQTIYRLWAAADPPNARAQPDVLFLAVALPELCAMVALGVLDLDDLADVRVWRAQRVRLLSAEV